ncbi:hypothetical protein [Frankia tisae]|uniref:hypothetical protein n=1 Tax=Frankia tisae TaxID=2950104 RepID=UPI0021C01C34|nr:hypothetical protein [Frankia tisae]
MTNRDVVEGLRPTGFALPLRWIGAAGVVMVVGIIGLGPAMGGPDSWASDAVAQYRDTLDGSTFLDVAPVRFGAYALLTAFEMFFFAGLWSWVRRIAPRSMASPLVALAAAGFVAGGIASDGFNFAQAIALHGGRGVSVDANLAVISDVASTLVIIEVNVCLAVAVAAVSAIGLRNRTLPAALCWYGLVAAAASALPGFFASSFPVFVLSNLLRLAFVVAISVLMWLGRVPGGEEVMAG